jgi:aspartate/methionine/tyrosine aminotransferase
LQHALARVLLTDHDYYSRLKTDFARKRQILASALRQVGFMLYESRSSFYIWARIPQRFSDASQLNELLITKARLAGVPGSAFMDDPEHDLYMRFCIAREDRMLEAAAARLVSAFGQG